MMPLPVHSTATRSVLQQPNPPPNSPSGHCCSSTHATASWRGENARPRKVKMEVDVMAVDSSLVKQRRMSAAAYPAIQIVGVKPSKAEHVIRQALKIFWFRHQHRVASLNLFHPFRRVAQHRTTGAQRIRFFCTRHCPSTPRRGAHGFQQGHIAHRRRAENALTLQRLSPCRLVGVQHMSGPWVHRKRGLVTRPLEPSSDGHQPCVEPIGVIHIGWAMHGQQDRPHHAWTQATPNHSAGHCRA